MAKHTEIYPKEEELQVVQRIVSHTERALKQVKILQIVPQVTLTYCIGISHSKIKCLF